MLRPIAPAVRHTIAIIALAALAACGGGGGDDTPSAGNTGPQVTVQGVAAKGLLRKAKVEVLQVNANGSTTLLKEDVTRDDGSYSLTGIPAGTAVVVRVTAVAGTQMVDEATGQLLDAPLGFAMRAAIVTQEGGTNALQITPFSEMAVAKAEANGGLSGTNIEAANADVRTYLGFDVLTEKPEFTNNGANPGNKAALAVAAISQLANGSGLGCTDAKQEDRVKCVVGKMALQGTDDSALADSIETAKDAIQVAKNYTGEVSPKPLPQPDKLPAPSDRTTAIADAKALIANLRSNGPFLAGSGSDTLEKRLSSTAEILRNASIPVDVGSQEIFKRVLDATVALDTRNYKPGVFDVSTDAANVARCSFFSNGSNPADNTLAEDAESANAIGCRLSYDIVLENGVFYAYQQGLRILRVEGVPNEYTVYTQVVKQRLVEDEEGELVNDTSNGATLRLPVGSQALVGEVTLTRDGPKLIGFGLTGDFATSVYNVRNGLAAKNTIEASVQPQTVGNGLTSLNVSGEFTSSGFNLPSATVGLAPGSYFETRFADPESFINSTEATQLDRSTRLILSGGVGETGVSGILTIRGFQPPQVPYGNGELAALPTLISFFGAIQQSEGVLLFEGEVAAEAEDLDSFNPNIDAGFSNQPTNAQGRFFGRLYVPSRPLMEVKLTLTAPARGITAVTGQYEQGATTVLISARRDADSQANTFVNLSTATGVNLRLKSGESRALLTKSDVAVGAFDADKARIDYVDGSFEQY